LSHWIGRSNTEGGAIGDHKAFPLFVPSSSNGLSAPPSVGNMNTVFVLGDAIDGAV
jgi:hypothetical protein